MGSRRVAIVGAGMTKFVRRALETPKELAYEASRMALDSCELSLKDIDAVTIGTAPDAFDGVHMNGEFLNDGAGAYRKPVMRNYVGGGTGVFAPIHGWFHVASGLFDTCPATSDIDSRYDLALAFFLAAPNTLSNLCRRSVRSLSIWA